MSLISIQYLGELRTQATHKKSGNQIINDAPIDNNGKGNAFSPTDLVATALATCMITVMGIKANLLTINIKNSSAEVEKIMTSNPRRIQYIKIEINIPNSTLIQKEKEILIKTAMECPVANSLHPDLIQQVKFEFN